MEAENHESVIKAIADLIRSHLVSLDLYEKQATEQPGERERLTRGSEKTEAGIFALMKLSSDLGMYEDVNWRVSVPQHLKEGFWGPEHPNAQRKDSQDQGIEVGNWISYPVSGHGSQGKVIRIDKAGYGVQLSDSPTSATIVPFGPLVKKTPPPEGEA